jgi:hypothetical protein
MGTAEQYRHTAWDCLKLAEASSNPQTRASMLGLAQDWVKLAKRAERNDQSKLTEYRAKGFGTWARGYRARAQDCMSLAESTNDPERRADLLLFARMWMSLTEPIAYDLRGAYEPFTDAPALQPEHRQH